MKKQMFATVMKVKSIHSAALQALGLSKEFVRNYSPVHSLLVYIAFRLAMSM